MDADIGKERRPDVYTAVWVGNGAALGIEKEVTDGAIFPLNEENNFDYFCNDMGLPGGTDQQRRIHQLLKRLRECGGGEGRT